MLDCTEEGERVRRLAELAILDAPIDPLMEKVCALACALLSVPMAFVTLLDDTMAHVMAHQGLERGAAPRKDAFCDITIRRDGPLIIPDTMADPRFRDNPLVTGGPRFRFYAGVPLALSPGVRLGAFCVGDRDPRDLSASQIALLENLAGLVVGQLTHHENRQELARQAIDLARKQEILSQTERLAKVGGFEIDPATRAMVWSDELLRLYRLDRSSAPTLNTFGALFKADEKTLADIFARLEEGKPLDIETSHAGGAEPTRHVHLHAESRTTTAGERKIVGIVQDITDRVAVFRELEWIATHDGLTKLHNRSAFNELIEREIRRADAFGKRIALILLDVDRFKTINDSLGHDAGDMVLIAVAQRLLQAVGARGVVGRIGGDEFGVLVGGFEAEGMVAVIATDILFHLRKPLVHGSRVLGTRATLGVALSSCDESTAASLFKDADIALYNAKQAGRDGFVFYRQSMRDDLEHRMSKLAMARAAVLAGQIEPWYQPKIDLTTGAVTGFEALLRWHHPSKGLCAPAEMGDAFSDTELAVTIGSGMLHRVTADMRLWRTSNVPFGHVALNVADLELQTGEYAERILRCLATHDLPPDTIEVEITESVLIGPRSGIVAKTLRKLADARISIALDDFGTGFASLMHLKQHPIDWIKIDRSFVMEVENDHDAAAIVHALTSLAGSLGIGVVAEGVETRSQLEFLRARCARGQGFLFAKPMPAARVPHFLRTWSAPWDAERLRLASG